MTNFEMIKMMNIDEFVDWLDKYGDFENAPWMEWWNKNYCSKCESEKAYFPYLNKELECAWCELYDKCRFFPELPEVPTNKETIKMWLEKGE